MGHPKRFALGRVYKFNSTFSIR